MNQRHDRACSLGRLSTTVQHSLCYCADWLGLKLAAMLLPACEESCAVAQWIHSSLVWQWRTKEISKVFLVCLCQLELAWLWWVDSRGYKGAFSDCSTEFIKGHQQGCRDAQISHREDQESQELHFKIKVKNKNKRKWKKGRETIKKQTSNILLHTNFWVKTRFTGGWLQPVSAHPAAVIPRDSWVPSSTARQPQ